MFEEWCKIFQWNNKAWEQRGSGNLQIPSGFHRAVNLILLSTRRYYFRASNRSFCTVLPGSISPTNYRFFGIQRKSSFEAGHWGTVFFLRVLIQKFLEFGADFCVFLELGHFSWNLGPNRLCFFVFFWNSRNLKKTLLRNKDNQWHRLLLRADTTEELRLNHYGLSFWENSADLDRIHYWRSQKLCL